MKKHIKTLNKIACLIIIAAAFAGCGKEKPRKNFVARVNNSYLTEEQLAKMINSKSASDLYRSEVIRNWINRELLYQTAKSEGVLKSGDYKKIISRTEKELAASMLVQKYYNKEKTIYDPKYVIEYYKKHQNEFKRFYDSYLINMINFTNEDKAIQFRNTVLESDWERALNVFKGDSSVYSLSNNDLYYDYEIHPASLSRIVSSLNPGEVSIVITNEPGHYIVVQEIQKYEAGSVPPFEVIKQQVALRYEADRKNILIKKYINELYSKNDIEVRN